MTDKEKNEELAKMYGKMLDLLGKDYKEGFYKWVDEKRPDIAKRLVILDEKIEAVWEQCLKGECSVDQFQVSMDLYVATVQKTLKLYSPEGK